MGSSEKLKALTLYDRLGGSSALKQAVDIFYKKTLEDEELAPFFEGVDMYYLQLHQEAFMSYAFGASTPYTGPDIRQAHKSLVEDKGLTDKHFDRVAVHLHTTLSEMDVSQNLIEEVLEIVGGTRGEILNR